MIPTSVTELLKIHATCGVNRLDTFEKAIELAVENGCKTIVETGCMRRDPNENPDGASTLVLGTLAREIGGRLFSMDLNQDNLDLCSKWCKGLPITFVQGDSIESLMKFFGTIDLLYLDSYDCDGIPAGPAQKHQLSEAQAAIPHMSEKSVIVSDDWGQIFNGKGGLAVPFLQWMRYRIVSEGYQIVLARP